jgi:hypothetical protein
MKAELVNHLKSRVRFLSDELQRMKTWGQEIEPILKRGILGAKGFYSIPYDSSFLLRVLSPIFKCWAV